MQERSAWRVLMSLIPSMVVLGVLGSTASVLAEQNGSAASDSQVWHCSNETLSGKYGSSSEGVLLPAPGVAAGVPRVDRHSLRRQGSSDVDGAHGRQRRARATRMDHSHRNLCRQLRLQRHDGGQHSEQSGAAEPVHRRGEAGPGGSHGARCPCDPERVHEGRLTSSGGARSERPPENPRARVPPRGPWRRGSARRRRRSSPTRRR